VPSGQIIRICAERTILGGPRSSGAVDRDEDEQHPAERERQPRRPSGRRGRPTGRADPHEQEDADDGPDPDDGGDGPRQHAVAPGQPEADTRADRRTGAEHDHHVGRRVGAGDQGDDQETRECERDERRGIRYR
jgi:hypothetical protein